MLAQGLCKVHHREAITEATTGAAMKFLIDTNILITLEPSNELSIEPGAPRAAEVARRIQETGNSLLIHPASWVDVRRDRNQQRRKHREHVLAKYPLLIDPPSASPQQQARLGSASPESNDGVDNQLLVAVARDAADYLITEDQAIHRKAAALGVADRVLSIADALLAVSALYEKTTTPPPAVRATKSYNLDENDPIFASFRQDYAAFDDWLRRCKLDGRPTWVIDAPGSRLAAVCIVKAEYSTVTRTLKICSFKVADEFSGARYGELLLKAVLSYALENGFPSLYVTAFSRHAWLVNLLCEFGFVTQADPSSLGELVLAKELVPLSSSGLQPFEFAVRYGPRAFLWEHVSTWIVPIQPRYDDILFPDRQNQQSLFPGQGAAGNAMRKAYLCRAPVRRLKPGDVLCFYRSETSRSIRTLGVVENVLVSSEWEQLGGFVARRTVYSMQDIKAMCDGGREVLAIHFRQVLYTFPEVTHHELEIAGVISGAPQSIMEVKENRPWLIERIRPSSS